MTDIEKQIEAMGYEVRVSDMSNEYIVYENKKSDQEVILEWDYEDQYCMIFLKSSATDTTITPSSDSSFLSFITTLPISPIPRPSTYTSDASGIKCLWSWTIYG